MTNTFVTVDSGKRDTFESGAKRDTQDEKPRYDLIPIIPLRRLADLYMRGAKKYGEHNYQKGIPFSRIYSSALRHLHEFAEGLTEEDHLAAVVWNCFSIMFYQDQIEKGKLPKELNDLIK